MRIGLLLSVGISIVIGLRCLELYQLGLSILLAAFCTSNSFIIMEDQISLFLTQMITCAFAVINKDVINQTQMGLIGLQLALSRLSFELRRCRPEQFWCYSSGRKDNSIYSVNLSIFFVIISVSIFLWQHQRRKSLVERYTITMILPTVIAIWISWIVPIVPSDILLKHASSTNLSIEMFHRLPEYVGRFALIVSTVGFGMALFKLPVSISRVDPRPASEQTGIIVRMEGVKFELTGLDRAMDTARLIQLVWQSILWSLLLGPNLSISSSFFWIDLMILDYLLRSGLKWNSILVTRSWMISNLFFYSSGHTTTFSGIPVYATAVGFKNHSTQFIPFLMVLVNTYGSHIMSYLYLTKLELNVH